MVFMRPADFQILDWPTGWRGVQTSDEGNLLERELAREVTRSHVLFGKKVVTIGRRDDCDDVLFFVESIPPQVAVVHLTWHQHNSPPWPDTVLHSSVDEWIAANNSAESY